MRLLRIAEVPAPIGSRRMLAKYDSPIPTTWTRSGRWHTRFALVDYSDALGGAKAFPAAEDGEGLQWDAAAESRGADAQAALMACVEALEAS